MQDHIGKLLLLEFKDSIVKRLIKETFASLSLIKRKRDIIAFFFWGTDVIFNSGLLPE